MITDHLGQLIGSAGYMLRLNSLLNEYRQDLRGDLARRAFSLEFYLITLRWLEDTHATF
jgi:hypothetical protein